MTILEEILFTLRRTLVRHTQLFDDLHKYSIVQAVKVGLEALFTNVPVGTSLNYPVEWNTWIEMLSVSLFPMIRGFTVMGQII